MAIKDWSITASSNNSAPPDGFPEGMAPSAVNDAARETMAQVRTWYEDAEWINRGYTYTYVAATQFKISGTDYTSVYHVGRRVRAVGSGTGTIYGTISVSSFSTDTTITVVFDSGTLSNETLQISYGVPSAANGSIPGATISEDDWTIQGSLTVSSHSVLKVGSDEASASALSPTGGTYFDVTGTTAITSISTIGVGALIVLQFDGALTLTHHATNLILPGAADITTAAGDIATLYEYATGTWRCISYTKASGVAVAVAAVTNTWVDLGTTTFSATANFELALSATYREYRLVVEELLPATNDQGLVATVSDGAYKSSGYMYSVLRQTSTAVDAVASGSAASILLSVSTGFGNVDTEEAFGEILIKGHQNASGQCHITSHIVTNDATVPEQYWGQGRHLTDGAITAFKLAFESGNIASGSISVYGLKA